MSKFRGPIVGVTMEAPVKSHASRCGIFGKQISNGARFRSVLYGTQRYSTVLYGTQRYSTVLHGTQRYSTVLYGTLRYSTVLYGTLPYSTVLYRTLRYSTVLYGTLRYSTTDYIPDPYSSIMGIGELRRYSDSERAGLNGFRTPVAMRDILFSISAQTLTGVHPASSTMGTPALSWEYSGQSV